MLPIASMRRQLPKTQLCLPNGRSVLSNPHRRVSFTIQTNPTQKPTMGVLKRNSYGNDVAKWQR
jgi:hypothetical protein